MAAFQVDANSPLAKAIQDAVQPQIVANGWVSEENDATLAEYIIMMLVNGQDEPSVTRELGADLLGADEDDPKPAEFTHFLFEQARNLYQAGQQANAPVQQQQQQQSQQAPSDQDTQMSIDAAPVENAPTGPRSMRNGSTQRGRGGGGRILQQMNRTMDRSQELPDSLRRIKGAAGGTSGRINGHAGPPRGPRGGSSGLQRMANGGGRGGNMAMNPMNMNNAMAQANPMASAGPQDQVNFMQMMEMQQRMFAQLLANGQMPVANGHYHAGGHRGGRGGRGGPVKPRQTQLHAVNGRLPDGPLTPSTNSAMDIDTQQRPDLFGTLCKFNMGCTNPACGFAHQSPAAPPNTPVDLDATCPHGVACTNHKCGARHPSPAQRGTHKLEVDCKFFPNCTNPSCPFRHPTEKQVCRNGADCPTPNCPFAHSKIVCRYTPCLNPKCTFKHSEGQRGNFADKVWTPGDKVTRFEAFAKQTEDGEELILPNAGDAGDAMEAQAESQTLPESSNSDAQIMT